MVWRKLNLSHNLTDLRNFFVSPSSWWRTLAPRPPAEGMMGGTQPAAEELGCFDTLELVGLGAFGMAEDTPSSPASSPANAFF
jgi:hypothetical protein